MGRAEKQDNKWDKAPVSTPEFDRIITEDEWYIPSVDGDGHGAREYSQVPPQISRAMSEHVQGGALPYKTHGDLIRHAIYRHLHWLDWLKNSNQANQMMLGLEAALEVVREDYRKARNRLLVETLRDQCVAYARSGQMKEAARLYARVRQIIDKHDQSVWRDKLISQLTDLYQTIIASGAEPIPINRNHLANSSRMRPKLGVVLPQSGPNEDQDEEGEDQE